MPTLHLIVGLPCAGKTTLARQLEQQHHALRLTPDEWHIALFGNDLADPAHDARHTTVEALMWGVAARALALGTNVILDFGFWARAERDDFRARAARLGAACVVHALVLPKAELLARLEARNAALPPGTFYISPTYMHQWYAIFQPPSADELDTPPQT
jgi:predicted kinase